MGLRGKRILVTCGPTWVAIDPMRVISNCSSGTMGHTCASALNEAGARVTVLEGPVECPLKTPGVQVKKFRFFAELKTLLENEVKKNYAAVVHAAAVADYAPQKPLKSKISSGKKELTLRLAPTPKLINTVKSKAPKTFLVGFKLESTHQRAQLVNAAKKLMTQAHCDLVVGNSLAAGYRGYIIDKKYHVMATAHSRLNLVKKLVQLLDKSL